MGETLSILGYLAGILLIIAVLMTSIRALRIFALLGGLAALAYFGLRGDGPFEFILAGLFVVANGMQLGILISRARKGNLLVDEQALFAQVLGVDNPGQRNRLRDLLAWRELTEGEVLMTQGQSDPPLVYIASGSAEIEHDGRLVGVCGAGDFAGEMSLISGEKASATVTANRPMRIAQFDRDALGHFSREVPEVGNAIASALNRGLAAKVSRMNQAATIKADTQTN
ncbi:Crp/Fnr family transcriptional regulator [Erythrobacter sp. W53]|uniref:Crp/Fnr family transcriptional regulator n=1 Tax=Erythrobacteraceae TaxID=335929 RepID=UPI0036D2D8B1